MTSRKKHVIKITYGNKRHLYVQRKVVIVLLLVVFIFIVGILVSMVAHAEGVIPEATSDFYVNDFAEVFSDDQEHEMMERAVALANKPEGIQVVVTTVKSLEGYSVEDYANIMYNQYAIGKDDRGLLILLSTTERKIRVEVGYGLESYMNDSKAGRFIDNYAISFLKNNQFDLGLVSLQKALVSDLDTHFDSIRETPVPASNRSGVLPADSQSNPVTETEAEEKNVIGTKSIDFDQLSETNYYSVIIIFSGIVAVLLLIGFIVFYLKYRKCSRDRDYESNEYDRKLRGLQSTISSLTTECEEAKSAYEVQKEVFRKAEKSRNETYHKLSTEHNELQSKYDNLFKLHESTEKLLDERSGKLSKISDRYERAKVLHSNLDDEIDTMIQKEIDAKNRQMAAQFDSLFSVLATDELLSKCDTSVDPKSYITFEASYQKAFDAFDRLNSEQRAYVTTDIQAIRKKYQEGIEKKSREIAESYSSKTQKACDTVKHGTETNLSGFQKLFDEFQNMDKLTQGFISVQLIDVLKRFIQEGKKDRDVRIARELEEERKRKEEQRKKEEAERKRREEERQEEERRRKRQREEEERRRRMRQQEEMHRHSSSSSFHSGGFGGFGGHSGGGGASRGF